jgi:hypothetical protein
MRALTATILAASLLAPTAQAERRTFMVASNPEGYGIDHCLATGAPCGTAVAAAYCQARDFDQVLSFRLLDRQGASVPPPRTCPTGACGDAIAIECLR